MILKNNEHPDGVELTVDRSVTVSPCTTRKMTPEEWEKYGQPNPVEVKRVKSLEDCDFNVWLPTAQDCDFAKRMREERIRRGMSQKKLAKLVGVAQVTIGHYESLRYRPRLEVREKLEKVLGLSSITGTDAFHQGH